MDSFKKVKDDLKAVVDRLNSQKNNSIRSIDLFKRSVLSRFDGIIARTYKRKNLKKVVLENKIVLKKQRLSVWTKMRRAGFKKCFKNLLSAPFIYMMIAPSLVLHLFLEIYHQICFRLYGIPLVNPRHYFVFDRKGLPYLNLFERFNCFYCSYFNCLVAYLSEIAGRTERYWCPIKHARKLDGVHSQYDVFVDYDDGESLREEWDDLRKFEGVV